MTLDKKMIKFLQFAAIILLDEGYFGLAEQAIELVKELENREKVRNAPYGICNRAML